MTYDPSTNLLTRIDYPGGLFFTFEYDAAGRRTKRTDQDGHVENSTYDALGRLDTMTDENGALIVHYEYDAAGRLSKKTLGNGVYTTYVYDAAGNVVPPCQSPSRRLDPLAVRLHLRRLRPPDLDDDARRDVHLRLRPAGPAHERDLPRRSHRHLRLRRGRQPHPGRRQRGRDRLHDEQPEPVHQRRRHDLHLRRRRQHDLQDRGGVTTHYTYDVENRLIGVTTPTDTWTYRYDAFGNRIASTHNGVVDEVRDRPDRPGQRGGRVRRRGNLVARYDYGYGLLVADRCGGIGLTTRSRRSATRAS